MSEITTIQNELATVLSAHLNFLVQPTIPTEPQSNQGYLSPPAESPMFSTRDSPATFARPTLRLDLVILGSVTDRPESFRWLQDLIVPLTVFLKRECGPINGHRPPAVNNVRMGLVAERFPAATFELQPIQMECM